jgi:hypothetical protein
MKVPRAPSDAHASPNSRAQDVSSDSFCAEYLTTHGVSVEYARACGLQAIPDGWDKKKNRPIIRGLFIPYYGKLFRLRRRRTHIPAEEEGGTLVRDSYDLTKFLTPSGADVAPYFPPSGMPRNWTTDTTIDLFFSEGPVKALCLTEHGFPCIGLGGVEAGFHDVTAKRTEGALEVHARLRTIAWKGRKVFVAYDAMRVRNPSVARGEARLAHILGKQGAIVYLIELPVDSRLGKDVAAYLDDEKDQGPDDFIVRAGRRYLEYMQTHGAKHGLSREAILAAAFDITQDRNAATAAADGAEAGLKFRGGRRAFRALVDVAVPADPVERVRACHDADQARRLLDDLTFQASLDVGGATSIAAVVSEFKRTFKLDIGKTAIGEKVAEYKVRAAAKASAAAAQSRTDILSNQYEERGGNTCLVFETAAGKTYKQVANFTAKITREVSQDDGVTCSKTFTIEGKLAKGRPLPTLEIAASTWTDRTWVAEHWGARAVVEAGRDSWGHLLAAIQQASDPETATVYTHTGWRRIRDRMAYLFPGGSIGADAADVRTPDEHNRYGFPQGPYSKEAVTDAIRRSLSLLTLGDPKVTVPTVAAAYTAPLSTILEIDFGVWLAGESGSCKSGLAALMMNHYGAFSYSALPMSWMSTVNAIESFLFKVKDALAVIDNYIPGDKDGSSKVNRIVQQIGDRASRGRLAKTSEAMPSRPPRGLMLATGEDVPVGSSDSAIGRLVVVRVRKADGLVARVIEASKHTEDYGLAMRSYIEWFAADYDTQSDTVRRHREQLARNFSEVVEGHAVHPRTARSVATLGAGVMSFLRFAREVEAVTSEEHENLREIADRALIQVAREQAVFRENTTPVQRYLSTLKSMLLQGRVTLAERGTDLDAEKGIGWMGDDEYIFLEPDLAWRAIEEFHSTSAQKWPFSKTGLHQSLVEAGIVHRGEASRADAWRAVGTKGRVRVLLVHREHLADAIPGCVDFGADDTDEVGFGPH